MKRSMLAAIMALQHLRQATNAKALCDAVGAARLVMPVVVRPMSGSDAR